MPNFIPKSSLYILTASIKVFNAFSFLSNSLMSSIYIRWLIFSYDSWSLYSPVHFLKMWISGIIAITNNNGNSTFPCKTTFWIFTSSKLFPPVTQCRWPAKQTIPLSVFARNQTKDFGLEISPCPEEVTVREKRVGLGGSWRETTDRGSRHRTPERWDQAAWDGVQRQWRRSSQDESAFQLLCRIFASNPR